MQVLKKIIGGVVLFFLLLIAFLYIFDYDYLIKAVRTIYLQGHTTAFLDDYKEFDNHVIKAAIPQPWPVHKNYNSVKETQKLSTLNKQLGTVAFVIIKNDSIWFEKYYDEGSKTSKTNSFSMAKSMVSAMLGKAIMQGKIKSLNQPVSDFYPEFKDGLASKLTVGDLSSMASGSDWDEAYYSPFSITTRAYFDDDLEKVMLGRKIVRTPGTAYKYASGDTQLLGLILQKATGKSLSAYLSENFWKPMGANEALWQVDSEEEGHEKAYCCIAASALDFARFGKLYKDHGKWNGKQLLDSAFIAKSVTPRFKTSPQYGYGWWLKEHSGRSFFMMRGHLGQYVIVQPQDNVIIVRLGHSKGEGNAVASFTPDIATYIEEAYKMMENVK
ncbi:serine hydrolase domain-containing protein [Abyssalbus ytuae]|uniref:Beta-lactamase family protein n=1 Tax=Abyssalbus ytuae TaxID=2926907 RepID=A0A9E6ZI52_9FLAO|nr:serine hydrolase [Abyssalbus ytuae]UOB15929.1 beta-lactamase family protein [Abyssalbus ytuae]